MDPLQSSAPPTTLSTVSIQVAEVTSNSVILEYAGLPGNMPSTYHNSVLLFRSAVPAFPYITTNRPDGAANIPGNTSSGTVVIPANILMNTSYVVGYAVGPVLQQPAQTFGNVCTSAWIPPEGSDYQTTTPDLTLNYVSPSVIAVTFKLGDGLTPSANGAWIGLWRGNYPSYTIPPMYAEAITTKSSYGQVVFNVPVMRGTMYTLGLCMSGWSASGNSVQTSMAATLAFSV